MQGIENLVDEAGIPVAFERRGEPRRLPAVVRRGAYRVVRDALHAARSASVEIEFMPGALAVQVDADGEGDGLDEVAEIAAALGGGLRSVSRPGGFRVRAWLPTEGQPPCPAAPLAVR
jgi:hypothetical protein